MWVRSGFWMGQPKAGEEANFREGVTGLVPRLAALPGVTACRALWPERLEDDPPGVACQMLVEFDTLQDLDAMLASPERRAMREHVLAVVARFDGRICHIDYEVG